MAGCLTYQIKIFAVDAFISMSLNGIHPAVIAGKAMVLCRSDLGHI